MMKRLSVFYKGLIVLCAVTGILLQCGVASGNMDFQSFRMFTTLSNLAVAVYFIWDLIYICRYPQYDNIGNHWKFLVSMGILLTGLVAHFMLRGMFTQLQGGEKLGITLLHYAVPIMTILDYVLFDQKGKVRVWMPLFAAVFPVLYAAVSLFAAQWMTGTDRYPYPFLNVDLLGWNGVLLNILLLALGYFAVGYLIFGLDRIFGKQHR